MKRFILFVFLGITLVGCEQPETVYFAQIAKFNFIPFKMPMAGVGTGTLLRGGPDNLMALAPSTRCFPRKIDGLSTDLRWESEVALPSTYNHFQLDFSAKLNSIIATGTPAITFNLDMSKVKKVDFEIKSASVEMFDQLALRDFYKYGMTTECQKLVLQYPFILDGLEVTSMSFTFLDSFGGKIALSAANIGDFATINVGINWQIENGYKLIITTPKFVGYHLVQLRPQDDGFVHSISSKIKDGAFIWQEIAQEPSSLRALQLDQFLPTQISAH